MVMHSKFTQHLQLVSRKLPAPDNFHLYQNFPNPFNPSTTIKYNLPTESSIQLKIFDIKGELIKTITGDKLNAGEHEIIWDGTNDKGVRQPSGVYVYQLNVNNSNSARKMILLK